MFFLLLMFFLPTRRKLANEPLAVFLILGHNLLVGLAQLALPKTDGQCTDLFEGHGHQSVGFLDLGLVGLHCIEPFGKAAGLRDLGEAAIWIETPGSALIRRLW